MKIIFVDKTEYQPIVDFLLTKIIDDLEIPFPRMKDIEEAMIKKVICLESFYYKCTIIYLDSLIIKLSFNKVLYHFTINYYGKNCYFILDKLEHLCLELRKY
jgi:hypothetical protein